MNILQRNLNTTNPALFSLYCKQDADKTMNLGPCSTESINYRESLWTEYILSKSITKKQLSSVHLIKKLIKVVSPSVKSCYYISSYIPNFSAKDYNYSD